MLFNSIEFAFFLPIVFLLYWFVFDYALSKCKHQLWLQNLFIVVASYIFYGWWDWRFLILIAITSFCSWGSGLLIGKREGEEAKEKNTPYTLHLTQKPNFWPRFWLISNIILNLSILVVYKYYDFFAREFAYLFGIESDFLLLHLILPVGISFYTFQALSYSIDVYRGHIQPTKDIVAFTAFLSFFPQLVAGPIERATNLLPQFQRKRTFDYAQAVDGMRQILWGLFKKIVIADNCAVYVDTVFADISGQSGSTLVLAAVLFTFQIYGDFSGYSDIAIGTAKLFGIKLMRNFNVPYFSRDIAEFWRRWHISLTTWFRDYVYIPLGGSRPTIPGWLQCKVESVKCKDSDNAPTSNIQHLTSNIQHITHPTQKIINRYTKAIAVRNTFIIFLLSGFWHGANWTFIVWGIYHALLFVPLLLMGKNRRYVHQKINASEWPRMLLTLVLVMIGWVLFRAPSIADAWGYVCGICSGSLWSLSTLVTDYMLWVTVLMIVLMIVVEWRGREQDTAPLPHNRWVYYAIVLLIYWFATDKTTEFIYFQF